jgi:alpha-beta hydrolase superfamily lysophospholipase
MKQWLRRLSKSLALLLLGALLGALATYLFGATRGARLEAWHRLHPRGELTAAQANAVPDLAAYRQLEARLFEETSAELARQVDRFPPFSRFNPASRTHPARFGRDWNRTFELTPAGPARGEALLLHGLSDSPYSLRAVGQLLAANGYHVIGLRLPGHGVVPGGLSVATRHDWRAAVRLGVAATGGRAAASGRPFVVVGYSNGAALALDFTLTAIEEGDGPVPDRLILLSPALALRSGAGLARWQLRLSRLPGLGKLAWNSIQEEFDPFKFNSFPIQAAAEIHALTGELEERLVRLERADDRSLPPILTLQSVVDATIPPVASLTRLYGRVRRSTQESELVLFDANRSPGIGALLSPAADELLALAKPGRRFEFRVTLITNAATGTPQLVARSQAPGSPTIVDTPLALSWPEGVYSLSHVAIPFPPDDPAYGVGTSPAGPPFPLGALALKGERGIFRIPDHLLTRLRYNPFFEVVERRIVDFL